MQKRWAAVDRYLSDLLAPPDPADAYAARVHVVAPRAQQRPVELHEEPDLLGGPGPVLRRERVHGQVADARLERSLDDVEQRPLACLMAHRAVEPTRLRPAPVAIHDDGDMGRDALRAHSGAHVAGSWRLRRGRSRWYSA